MHRVTRPRRRQWLGRTLALAGAAVLPAAARAAGQRIVSVGGAITETLYALGAQGELVGVDTTSIFPAEARQLPSVGYQRALSAEGVLSLAPTMVLAGEDTGPPAVLRQLEAARMPVHLLDSGHTIEGVIGRSRRIGELTGHVAAGTALAERLQADWRACQARVAELAPRDPAKALRVLFVLAPVPNQLRAAGTGTGAHALIGYAGARNAFADAEGYKLLSAEAAVAAAPDVIVTTDHGLASTGSVANLLRMPGLAQTPAGRSQRVVTVEILMALGFGPRLPLAVRTLAEALHARPTS